LEIIKYARDVISVEIKELEKLSNNLDEGFSKSVISILGCRGKVIISGMGKSGIIGKKIAATLASTGTPSFFLHPSEAYHGDLGMIEKDDIVIVISNSGETDEILKIIPFLKEQGNIIIGMSGNPESTLAKNSKYHLNVHVDVEACPLQLAPTSSTTATLVMGDSIAVSLMKMRDFKDENFAKFHPGGSLGKRLLTKVKDVMKKDSLPICEKDTPIKDVIHKITKGGCGLVVVMANNNVVGIITDGDIRRAMEDKEDVFFILKAFEISSYKPKSINYNSKLTEAGDLMNKFKINSLIVLNDESELVGVVEMHQLGA
jgi:arabinose-5-phosphate isomerase